MSIWIIEGHVNGHPLYFELIYVRTAVVYIKSNYNNIKYQELSMLPWLIICYIKITKIITSLQAFILKDGNQRIPLLILCSLLLPYLSMNENKNSRNLETFGTWNTRCMYTFFSKRHSRFCLVIANTYYIHRSHVIRRSM